MNDRELQHWVDKWSAQYPAGYDAVLEPLASREGFTPGDLEVIYWWKYRGLWPQRKIDQMRNFPDGKVASLSRRAFACPDELGALRILMLIPGAQAAGASAILMAHNPEVYTVMDVRAINSLTWPLKLWSKEDQGTKASSLEWPDYLDRCRAIASRTSRSLRTVDRALYASNGRA